MSTGSGRARVTPGRRVQSVGEIERPGDYCGPDARYTNGIPAVFFLKPNARDADAPPAARSVQHVCSPPYEFSEQPDGSLQVRPALPAVGELDADGRSDDGWHGYLGPGHVWWRVS